MRDDVQLFTPSQVNQYIKSFMDRDRLLSGLLVRGELSNYKTYPSGHHYFSLKDGEGSLRCVMFRGDAASLRFRPQNGMQVVAAGRITVFPRDGQYQLYCTRLIPEGMGDLHLAFEQLKENTRSRVGVLRPGEEGIPSPFSSHHRTDHLSGGGSGAGYAAHPAGPLAHGPGENPPCPGAGGGGGPGDCCFHPLGLRPQGR